MKSLISACALFGAAAAASQGYSDPGKYGKSFSADSTWRSMTNAIPTYQTVIYNPPGMLQDAPEFTTWTMFASSTTTRGIIPPKKVGGRKSWVIVNGQIVPYTGQHLLEDRTVEGEPFATGLSTETITESSFPTTMISNSPAEPTALLLMTTFGGMPLARDLQANDDLEDESAEGRSSSKSYSCTVTQTTTEYANQERRGATPSFKAPKAHSTWIDYIAAVTHRADPPEKRTKTIVETITKDSPAAHDSEDENNAATSSKKSYSCTVTKTTTASRLVSRQVERAASESAVEPSSKKSYSCTVTKTTTATRLVSRQVERAAIPSSVTKATVPIEAEAEPSAIMVTETSTESKYMSSTAPAEVEMVTMVETETLPGKPMHTVVQTITKDKIVATETTTVEGSGDVWKSESIAASSSALKHDDEMESATIIKPLSVTSVHAKLEGESAIVTRTVFAYATASITPAPKDVVQTITKYEAPELEYLSASLQSGADAGIDTIVRYVLTTAGETLTLQDEIKAAPALPTSSNLVFLTVSVPVSELQKEIVTRTLTLPTTHYTTSTFSHRLSGVSSALETESTVTSIIIEEASASEIVGLHSSSLSSALLFTSDGPGPATSTLLQEPPLLLSTTSSNKYGLSNNTSSVPIWGPTAATGTQLTQVNSADNVGSTRKKEPSTSTTLSHTVFPSTTEQESIIPAGSSPATIAGSSVISLATTATSGTRPTDQDVSVLNSSINTPYLVGNTENSNSITTIQGSTATGSIRPIQTQSVPYPFTNATTESPSMGSKELPTSVEFSTGITSQGQSTSNASTTELAGCSGSTTSCDQSPTDALFPLGKSSQAAFSNASTLSISVSGGIRTVPIESHGSTKSSLQVTNLTCSNTQGCASTVSVSTVVDELATPPYPMHNSTIAPSLVSATDLTGTVLPSGSTGAITSIPASTSIVQYLAPNTTHPIQPTRSRNGAFETSMGDFGTPSSSTTFAIGLIPSESPPYPMFNASQSARVTPASDLGTVLTNAGLITASVGSAPSAPASLGPSLPKSSQLGTPPLPMTNTTRNVFAGSTAGVLSSGISNTLFSSDIALSTAVSSGYTWSGSSSIARSQALDPPFAMTNTSKIAPTRLASGNILVTSTTSQITTYPSKKSNATASSGSTPSTVRQLESPPFPMINATGASITSASRLMSIHTGITSSDWILSGTATSSHGANGAETTLFPSSNSTKTVLPTSSAPSASRTSALQLTTELVSSSCTTGTGCLTFSTSDVPLFPIMNSTRTQAAIGSVAMSASAGVSNPLKTDALLSCSVGADCAAATSRSIKPPFPLSNSTSIAQPTRSGAVPTNSLSLMTASTASSSRTTAGQSTQVTDAESSPFVTYNSTTMEISMGMSSFTSISRSHDSPTTTSSVYNSGNENIGATSTSRSPTYAIQNSTMLVPVEESSQAYSYSIPGSVVTASTVPTNSVGKHTDFPDRNTSSLTHRTSLSTMLSLTWPGALVTASSPIVPPTIRESVPFPMSNSTAAVAYATITSPGSSIPVTGSSALPQSSLIAMPSLSNSTDLVTPTPYEATSAVTGDSSIPIASPPYADSTMGSAKLLTLTTVPSSFPNSTNTEKHVPTVEPAVTMSSSDLSRSESIVSPTSRPSQVKPGSNSTTGTTPTRVSSSSIKPWGNMPTYQSSSQGVVDQPLTLSTTTFTGAISCPESSGCSPDIHETHFPSSPNTSMTLKPHYSRSSVLSSLPSTFADTTLGRNNSQPLSGTVTLPPTTVHETHMVTTHVTDVITATQICVLCQGGYTTKIETVSYPITIHSTELITTHDVSTTTLTKDCSYCPGGSTTYETTTSCPVTSVPRPPTWTYPIPTYSHSSNSSQPPVYTHSYSKPPMSTGTTSPPPITSVVTSTSSICITLPCETESCTAPTTYWSTQTTEHTHEITPSLSSCPPSYTEKTKTIVSTTTDHDCAECSITPTIGVHTTTSCETWTIPASTSWVYSYPPQSTSASSSLSTSKTWYNTTIVTPLKYPTQATTVPPQYTTSTVWATSCQTVTSCPPSKPTCSSPSTVVTTHSTIISTTICPVPSTTPGDHSPHINTTSTYFTTDTQKTTDTQHVTKIKPDTSSVPVSTHSDSTSESQYVPTSSKTTQSMPTAHCTTCNGDTTTSSVSPSQPTSAYSPVSISTKPPSVTPPTSIMSKTSTQNSTMYSETTTLPQVETHSYSMPAESSPSNQTPSQPASSLPVESTSNSTPVESCTTCKQSTPTQPVSTSPAMSESYSKPMDGKPVTNEAPPAQSSAPASSYPPSYPVESHPAASYSTETNPLQSAASVGTCSTCTQSSLSSSVESKPTRPSSPFAPTTMATQTPPGTSNIVSSHSAIGPSSSETEGQPTASFAYSTKPTISSSLPPGETKSTGLPAPSESKSAATMPTSPGETGKPSVSTPASSPTNTYTTSAGIATKGLLCKAGYVLVALTTIFVWV